MFAQVNMTRNKIGVEMGFEDVFDGHPIGGSPVEIGLNFPQGINDGRFAIRYNVIGALCKAAGVNLL